MTLRSQGEMRSILTLLCLLSCIHCLVCDKASEASLSWRTQGRTSTSTVRKRGNIERKEADTDDFSEFESKSEWSEVKLGVSTEIENRVRSALDRTAVCTIAIGLKARSFTISLLRSFARNANFSGDLFILTENARFYRRLLQASEFEEVRSQIRLKTIKEDPERPLVIAGQTRRDRSLKGGERLAMRIKRLKTEIFSVIDDSAVQYLLFVDSDIVIGRPLHSFLRYCLLQYLDDTERNSEHSALSGSAGRVDEWEPRTDTLLALFRDIGRTESFYHGGVFFAHRYNSQPLLRAWHLLIGEGGYGRDQPALNASVTALQAERRMRLLPWGSNYRFYAFIGGDSVQRRHPYTLIHCTPHRLTHAAKFNFSLSAAERYFANVLRVPLHHAFVTAPPYSGWRNASDFVHTLSDTWLGGDQRQARAQTRRRKYERDLLRLPSSLLDEADAEVAARQREALRAFVDVIDMDLSRRYRWFCDDARGLNAFVLDYLRLHSQKRVNFEEIATLSKERAEEREEGEERVRESERGEMVMGELASSKVLRMLKSKYLRGCELEEVEENGRGREL